MSSPHAHEYKYQNKNWNSCNNLIPNNRDDFSQDNLTPSFQEKSSIEKKLICNCKKDAKKIINSTNTRINNTNYYNYENTTTNVNTSCNRSRSSSPCYCECHYKSQNNLNNISNTYEISSPKKFDNNNYLSEKYENNNTNKISFALLNEINNLKKEYNKVKNELEKAKNKKDASLSYIIELENEISNKNTKSSKIKNDGNYPKMLNRSYEVFDSFPNKLNYVDGKIKSGCNYYYNKKPDYKILIDAQKDWINKLPDNNIIKNSELYNDQCHSSNFCNAFYNRNLNNFKYGNKNQRLGLYKINIDNNNYQSGFNNNINNNRLSRNYTYYMKSNLKNNSEINQPNINNNTMINYLKTIYSRNGNSDKNSGKNYTNSQERINNNSSYKNLYSNTNYNSYSNIIKPFMYNNNNDSNDNKLKSYNYKKNNYIYDNNMDNKLKSNNYNNKLLSSNQPKEKYLIIDTKGDPINIGNKSLYAMKINPLLDENGKEIFDKNKNMMIISPNGEINTLNDLKPIILNNNLPLVNSSNKPYLGLNGIPLIDNNDNPFLGSGSLYDSNNKIIKGIIGILPKNKNGNLVIFDDNNNNFKINLESNNFDKPDIEKNINENLYLKPLIGKGGRVIKDLQNKPIMLDENNKTVKNSGVSFLLDKDEKPVYNNDGKPILIVEDNNKINNIDKENKNNNDLNKININKIKTNDICKKEKFDNSENSYPEQNQNYRRQNSSKLFLNKRNDNTNYYQGSCFACDVGCAVSISGYSPMNYSPYNNKIKRRDVTPLKKKFSYRKKLSSKSLKKSVKKIRK